MRQTTAKRIPAAPNVPTLAEQGIPDYATESWNALLAPKGTPQPIIDRLAVIVSDMGQDESIQKRMTEFGSVAAANRPDELTRVLREETAQWAKLVKEIGLK